MMVIMMMKIAICLWDWKLLKFYCHKTVAAITDLNCFEDIVAGSFEVHDGLLRVIMIFGITILSVCAFRNRFYFTKVTHM